PYGYCADISRTFFCEPGTPTARQRQLYKLAAEKGAHKCKLLRPGLSFRDFARHAWQIPERFLEQNYGCLLHGVGMVDEWPAIGCDPKDPLAQEGQMQQGR